jgi:uncharacterized membrane protein
MALSRMLLQITSGLWFVPVLCVVGGALVSFGTIAVDRAFNYQAIPSEFVGSPAAATAILQTIATSMVSLTALVLTITMVVVQLAMGQFSPRIVQRILQDKPSQFAIGLFVATFVHAILALSEVTIRPDGTGEVPGVAVATAFVLVLASIAVLVIYVNHIGQSLRVSALVELVGKDTRKLLDRLYPDKGAIEGPVDDAGQITRSTESGVIVKIGYEQLVEEATARACTLELIPALGTFVPADSLLFRVQGEAGGLDPATLQRALIMKKEPTLDEDVAYGIRLLVDIAQRSLADSPFQDPTTAVQAIDRLHDVLRQLVRRPFPDGRYRDTDGVVRLVVPTMTWEGYVHLAFDEIRMAGSGSPQVARRLRAALNDLRSLAPPDRAEAVEQQLHLLTRSTRAAIGDERELDIALGEDRQGFGIAAGGR